VTFAKKSPCDNLDWDEDNWIHQMKAQSTWSFILGLGQLGVQFLIAHF